MIRKFEMIDIRPMAYYLGIQVKKVKDEIYISQ